MANRIKLRGTTLNEFDLGLTNKFTLDASAFTADHTWVLPDSDGFSGDVLTTDGGGALSWTTPTSGGSSFVPYYIPTGNTFTVPENFQALFTIPIDAEGTIVVDGILVGVD